MRLKTMDDKMLFRVAKKYPDYYDELLSHIGGIPYQEYIEAEIDEPYAYGAFIANQIWDIVQADELDVKAVDKLVKDYAQLEAKIGGSANEDLRFLVKELERRAGLKRSSNG